MANYPVNLDKVYVTGNSMGGSGTWDIMIRWNTIVRIIYLFEIFYKIYFTYCHNRTEPTARSSRPDSPSLESATISEPLRPTRTSCNRCNKCPLDVSMALMMTTSPPKPGISQCSKPWVAQAFQSNPLPLLFSLFNVLILF
jgi:hypothetical protein